MVNLNELWVGERLRIIDSGDIGLFEGKINGLLKIKFGEKNILVDPKNLERAPEEDLRKSVLDFIETENKVEKKDFISKEIDLHIEILNPNLTNALPERIIDFQVKAFESFISKSLSRKINPVTIIHGRGAGVLKTLVHSSLSSNENVRHYHLVNNDGATVVYLKF